MKILFDDRLVIELIHIIVRFSKEKYKKLVVI